MSVYSPGELLTDDDVLDAVYDFLLMHMRPDIDPGRIVRGWENRAYLPSDAEDYAVISVGGTERVGTTVMTDNRDEDDMETVGGLREIEVQVDFCSLGPQSCQRANVLELLARSPVGVSFFNDYGLSCLYAENVASTEYQDGSRQMVKRYVCRLHLSGWFKVSVRVPHAIAVEPHVENVDAHHHPRD